MLDKKFVLISEKPYFTPNDYVSQTHMLNQIRNKQTYDVRVQYLSPNYTYESHLTHFKSNPKYSETCTTSFYGTNSRIVKSI
jgi:hypothetical protein